MKILYTNFKNGKLELDDVPIPSINENEILIESIYSAISYGTENYLIEFGKSNLIKKVINNKDKIQTVINNHSEFFIEEQFVDKVNIIHNNARPDWDTGNLARNWNQALIHGFKDLNNPDCKIVTTMQNDIVLSPNWATNLLKMHKKL